MKILVTGGHLTPALAFIDYAKKKNDDIVFVGRSHSSKTQGIKSREESEAKKRGITFEQLDSFKLHRHSKLSSIFDLPKLLISIFKSTRIIKTHKPDVIVSFGGYLAIPIVLVAKWRKIPIFTHEQTKYMGLSNRYISRSADIVGISWENTHNLPKKKNIILTGNPIRKQIKSKSSKPSWIDSQKPIVYVTGGNQGSSIINQTIQRLIPRLSKSYYVIHQCGGSGSANYLLDLNKSRDTLPEIQQKNYTIKEWFSVSEVSWILDNAICVIGRSGANTITELIYKSTPSILIPLPFSSHNEQYINAKMLESYHATILISQSKLSDKLLLNSIKKIHNNHQKYEINVEHAAELLTENAEKNIYKIVRKLNEKNKTE